MAGVQGPAGAGAARDAERAERLGLGRRLVYSSQCGRVRMREITRRKGTDAAHYVRGGPQGNDNNAFYIGTATTEI